MLPLLLAIGVTLLDQGSKLLIREQFHLYEMVAVVPGVFNLRYIQNTGAAWGIFADGHQWLAALSVAVLAALVAFRRHFFSTGLIDRLAYGLIIGGIVGNFIDRVRLNYVVDFLDFHWKAHHFPAFNVADAAICTGVGLYILSQTLQMMRQRKALRMASGGGPR